MKPEKPRNVGQGSAGVNDPNRLPVLTHVLLVEDNPHDAVIISRTLRKYVEARNIIAVGSGQEALDYLFGTGKFIDRDKSEIPQIIILDLHMPVLDGFEVLTIIRLYERLTDVPVIIFSGSDDDRDIKKSFELGANSYVVKPLDIEKFTQVIEEVVWYWLRLNRQRPTKNDPT